MLSIVSDMISLKKESSWKKKRWADVLDNIWQRLPNIFTNIYKRNGELLVGIILWIFTPQESDL